MENAQKCTPMPPANGAGDAGQQGGGDDVVDAEFEEVKDKVKSMTGKKIAERGIPRFLMLIRCERKEMAKAGLLRSVGRETRCQPGMKSKSVSPYCDETPSRSQSR